MNKQMNRILIYLILLAASIGIVTCVHDPVFLVLDDEGKVIIDPTDSTGYILEDTCDPDTVYFQNDILPIFLGSCAVTGCHDRSTREADIALVDYSNIMRGIVPGSPSRSKYYKVITLVETDDLMPRDPVTGQGFWLPDDQIDLIEKWINQYAQNNSCESCDTTNYTFTDAIMPIFNRSCATSIGCHASGSSNRTMTTYEEIKPIVDLGLIRDRVLISKDMPPSGPLTDCDQIVIDKWITEGAPNN